MMKVGVAVFLCLVVFFVATVACGNTECSLEDTYNESFCFHRFNNSSNNNNNNNSIDRGKLRFFTISSQRHELSPTCKL